MAIPSTPIWAVTAGSPARRSGSGCFMSTQPNFQISNKGKNLYHGKPAKAFPAGMLRRPEPMLGLSPEHARGHMGRLLGIAESAGVNVNLSLIGWGHSYFDTRYQWP